MAAACGPTLVRACDSWLGADMETLVSAATVCYYVGCDGYSRTVGGWCGEALSCTGEASAVGGQAGKSERDWVTWSRARLPTLAENQGPTPCREGLPWSGDRRFEMSRFAHAVAATKGRAEAHDPAQPCLCLSHSTARVRGGVAVCMTIISLVIGSALPRKLGSQGV
jgi:hypothetical protein